MRVVGEDSKGTDENEKRGIDEIFKGIERFARKSVSK